jgi:hypothetical protein
MLKGTPKAYFDVVIELTFPTIAEQVLEQGSGITVPRATTVQTERRSVSWKLPSTKKLNPSARSR